MKKVTFILLALISGTAFAQGTSATSEATATVSAEIVMPILINRSTDMDFGLLIGNADGGTVTIDHANNRTGNNDLLAPSTTTSAIFEVTAGLDYNYKIVIPAITLTGGDVTGGGAPMNLTFTNSLGASSKGTGEAQTLVVGGALVLNPNQAIGDYTGNVKVTVSYE